MNQESPEINEPTPESAHQFVPEISPEELQEMIDQLPVLREMLGEREIELRRLQAEHVSNAFEIMRLQQEIRELNEEISGRGEVVFDTAGHPMAPGGVFMQ